MGDDDIHFKMIGTNLSTVVGQLDALRRHPRYDLRAIAQTNGHSQL